jgi:hypothetical protein
MSELLKKYASANADVVSAYFDAARSSVFKY